MNPSIAVEIAILVAKIGKQEAINFKLNMAQKCESAAEHNGILGTDRAWDHLKNVHLNEAIYIEQNF